MDFHSNIKKIYLYKILSGVFFSAPIIVLYFQDNGLSFTEIMILQSIFSILIVLLEFPTGYLSDIIGRKKTLVLAAFSGILGLIAFSMGESFYEFFVGEFFFALYGSLSSGTMSAFTYESLKQAKQESRYKKVWGNATFYELLSLSVSNIVGGMLAIYSLKYPIYASIPFFLLLIPVALSMNEPDFHKKRITESTKGHFRKIFNIISSKILSNDRLKWLIIYSSIIAVFNGAAFWMYQPYLKVSGLDIVHLGVVFASFQVIAAFSSKYAHHIEVILGDKLSLVSLLFLLAISFLLMGNIVYLFSFSFCFLQQFVRGFKEVVFTDYINKLSCPNYRATILSAESFMNRLFYALCIPFIGVITDSYGILDALTILAIISFTIALFMVYIFKKKKII